MTNKLLLFTYLFLFSLIHAYEFYPFEIQTFAGYRQDQISWGTSDPSFSEKNVTKEEIDPIKLWQIGIQGFYCYSPSLYGKAIFQYAQELAANGKTSLVRKAQNRSGGVSQEISQTGRSQFTDRIWSTQLAVGYTGMFGPITFAPNVGFNFETQQLIRRALLTFPFVDSTITATTGAYRFIGVDIYTAIFGLDFIFQFEAMSRTQLRVGYNYQIGSCDLHSSYFIDSIVNETSPLQTTGRNIKSDFIIDRYLDINQLTIDGVMGMTSNLLLFLSFDWTYRKARNGTANEKSHGTDILTIGGSSSVLSIDNETTVPFLGLKWQSFAGSIGLSLQF